MSTANVDKLQDAALINANGTVGQPRGYLTTPGELVAIADKASRGIEPYRSAVAALNANVGPASNWPYSGFQNAFNRDTWDGASTLLYGKALAYHIKGDAAYAASVREQLVLLTNAAPSTSSDPLGIVRHILGFVAAADLIEGYSGWTLADKRAFQAYLASSKVWLVVDEVSNDRANNWGFMGSGAAAYIADYLNDYPSSFVGFNGMSYTAKSAWERSNELGLLRMDRGTSVMACGTCPDQPGIYPDGRIPHETGRGSTGCDGSYLLAEDSSHGYMIAAANGLVRHAELMLRRGDRRMYDFVTGEGRGSLLKAIRYVIDNPTYPPAQYPSRSWPWDDNQFEILEPAYRYYRHPAIGAQLKVGRSDRVIAMNGPSWGDGPNGFLDFTTLTHGFAPDENPGPPPVTPPPGSSLPAPSPSPTQTVTPTPTPTQTVTPTPTPTQTVTPSPSPSPTSTSVPAGSLTIAVAADASLLSEYPDDNKGSQNYLALESSPAKHFVLRFNVAGLSGKPVVRAKLRLYAAGSGSSGGTFYRAASSSWSESSVTWNNAPAVSGSALGSIGAISKGKWYEVDVTPAIVSDGTYSFRVVASASENNSFDYKSREGGSSVAPRLVIDYGGSAPAPSPSPTATPTATPTVTPSPSPTATPTATPTSSPTGSITVPVLADATVLSDYPTTNKGTQNYLALDTSPAKHFLLAFNVSGLSGRSVVRAKLRLYAASSGSSGGTFYRAASSSWSESSVTWNNAPAVSGSALGSIGAISSGNWYEVDVTPAIAADGTYSFRVVPTASESAAYDYKSKEGGSSVAPQLVIEYR